MVPLLISARAAASIAWKKPRNYKLKTLVILKKLLTFFKRNSMSKVKLLSLVFLALFQAITLLGASKGKVKAVSVNHGQIVDLLPSVEARRSSARESEPSREALRNKKSTTTGFEATPLEILGNLYEQFFGNLVAGKTTLILKQLENHPDLASFRPEPRELHKPPLFLATYHDNVEVIRELLRLGADPAEHFTVSCPTERALFEVTRISAFALAEKWHSRKIIAEFKKNN